MTMLDLVYSSPTSSDYSERSSDVRFRFCADTIENHFGKGCLVSLLDYGCGPGNLVSWLANNSPDLVGSYVGYDVRKKTIEHAFGLYPNKTFTSDIKTVPRIVDVGLALGALSYAPNGWMNVNRDKELCCKDLVGNLLGKVKNPGGLCVITARRTGFESSKDGKAMMTFSEGELTHVFPGSIIVPLFSNEWAVVVKP